jgi:hypothetical protein
MRRMQTLSIAITTTTNSLLAVMVLSLTCLTGCERSAPKVQQSSNAKTTSDCYKAPSSDDQTFWVIDWKFHIAQNGAKKVNYYLFQYTPGSNRDPCKEPQDGQVCNRDVTSATEITNICTHVAQTKTITEIIVRKDSIRAIGSNTKDCTCP